MPTIATMLEDARARLQRLTAAQAAAELAAGALLVDTRTYEQRSTGGTIAGAVVIDRTVFEWRLDPASPNRIPEVTGHDDRVIVLCAEGYSSSLAAATLQDLGLRNATDVIGGFEAWRAAGLPVERVSTETSHSPAADRRVSVETRRDGERATQATRATRPRPTSEP